MIKRLLFTFALLAGLAVAQAGPYPAPSIVFPTFPANSANNGNNIQPLPVPAYGSGLIIVTFPTVISGSPAGCSVAIEFGGAAMTFQSGALVNTLGFATTGSILVNSARFVRVIGSNLSPSHPVTTAAAEWSCGTYPTGGSVQVEFVPDGFSSYIYTHITTNASTILKQTAAVLSSITINQAGTGETITVWDNVGCSGTSIAVLTGFSSGQQFTYGTPTTTNGLCIQTAGTTAGDYTVSWR